ncbi:unnamed protein product [Bursaphelenchus xylophilus]|uniref:Aldehyde dehydrogenase n=1 Tax=Bursaphelenchus xylophilus TaxID=6326 RepID=A0A1I7RX39_BURXY|nr:unnamed protein product [Bursaphelenchus xylophilus]CAG9121303.1 unnamed protein product [Bursaphelenchus xylophilus]
MNYKQIISIQRQHVLTGIPAQLSTRRDQLHRLAKLLKEEEAALCEAVYKDLRRTPTHTKFMEFGMAINEVQVCLRHLNEWAQPEHVEKGPAQILDTAMIVKEPFGTCLLIAPWNYPLLMVFLPLATMLAAGNTVIIKPSEVSPNVAEALKDAFAKHFDPRQISVVLADAEGTGELLKERFDLILYTGSTAVGRVIMRAAAEHLTPVVLELGGKCPVIVDSTADIACTARRLAWGKFMNNGQTCVAPDYVLVNKNVKDKLLIELKKTLEEFYPEVESSKDYCRIINQRHFDRLNSLLDRSRGNVAIQPAKPNRDDLFIPPTVVEVDPDDALMESEIFGPILPVVTVNSVDEAVEFVLDREKPLALYLFSTDEKAVDKVVKESRSGAVTVNDVVLHMTLDTLPFGGVGQSGFGRYRSRHGFDQFSHHKAVLKRTFFGEQLGAARYPPLTEKKLRALKMVGNRWILPRIIRRLLAHTDVFALGVGLAVIVGLIGQFIFNKN